MQDIIQSKEDFDALAVDISVLAERYVAVIKLCPDVCRQAYHSSDHIDFEKQRFEKQCRHWLKFYDPEIIGDGLRVPFFGTHALPGELRGWGYLPGHIGWEYEDEWRFGEYHVDGGGSISLYFPELGKKVKDERIREAEEMRLVACKEYLFEGFKEYPLIGGEQGVKLLLPGERDVLPLIGELRSRIIRRG